MFAEKYNLSEPYISNVKGGEGIFLIRRTPLSP